MAAEFEIDDDKVIAHIIKNTDLLNKFLADLDDDTSFDFGAFLDFCSDELWVAEEFCREVAYGAFDVCVLEHQGISFVRVTEFADIGYFLDIEDAKSAALEFAADWPKSNWEDG